MSNKIICNTNYKNTIYNNKFYYIINEAKKFYSVAEEPNGKPLRNKKGEVFHFLKKYFDPTYFITIHKYQGYTIEEEYNIYDIDHPGFNFNLLYTSLSRTKKLKYVHFDYTDKLYKKMTECTK